MRSYRIPIKRVVIETADVYVRARDKGTAVALALADANDPKVTWHRRKPDVGRVSLDTRVPTMEDVAI